ncbi:MAG: hypothetical protein BWY82_02079 [Verrucomicrobia bacterium ADurb.Bin474]|nr:MAG: hypothetical protein BWY82_02079 [Verrucomicrobia bacterium ADurb.Bin474]
MGKEPMASGAVCVGVLPFGRQEGQGFDARIRQLGGRVVGAQGFDFIAKAIDAHRSEGIRGVDVDDAAADREFARSFANGLITVVQLVGQ